MQTEYWLSYAALTAFWLGVPGRAAYLVASCSKGKGRLSALSTLPAFVLGQLAAALAASHLTLLAGLVSPVAVSALCWIGGTLLAFSLLTSAVLPDLTGPFADNDNLRAGGPPRMALDVFAETFFERRTLFYYLAIVPHFLSQEASWQPQVVWLIVATGAPAVIAGLYPALARDLFLGRVRRRAGLRRRPVRDGMVSIASGAVTAGYRKIAA